MTGKFLPSALLFQNLSVAHKARVEHRFHNTWKCLALFSRLEICFGIAMGVCFCEQPWSGILVELSRCKLRLAWCRRSTKLVHSSSVSSSAWMCLSRRKNLLAVLVFLESRWMIWKRLEIRWGCNFLQLKTSILFQAFASYKLNPWQERVVAQKMRTIPEDQD